MVERIEKIKRQEHWAVDSTRGTREEKRREDRRPSYQEPQDSFEESSDFIQLLTKDPHQFSSAKIIRTQIKGFTFRSVTTHRGKSVLEVDISMSDGSLVKGAQIALRRQEGMRFLHRKPGEELVVDQIVQGSFLTVALPPKESPSEAFEASSLGETEKSEKIVLAPRRMNWLYFVGLGALVLATLMLFYLFLAV